MFPQLLDVIQMNSARNGLGIVSKRISGATGNNATAIGNQSDLENDLIKSSVRGNSYTKITSECERRASTKAHAGGVELHFRSTGFSETDSLPASPLVSHDEPLS